MSDTETLKMVAYYLPLYERNPCNYFFNKTIRHVILDFNGAQILMKSIRFSIVTPVYNGETSIACTIQSVSDQTVSLCEYNIVDG